MYVIIRSLLLIGLTAFAGIAAAQQAEPVPALNPAPKAAPAPAAAQTGRETIGWGSLFTNDMLGDGMDRWRTSSFTLSRVRGPEWTGTLPTRFGEIVEFRLRAEHISPANLAAPALRDRRYAGLLSFGFHSHSALRNEELSLGADVVFVGPQTGMSGLQGRLHQRLGLPNGAPSFNAQFGNDVWFSATGELGRNVALSGGMTLRPFVEGQAGVENLARVGFDLTLGAAGDAGLLLRDASTGQRYAAVRGLAANGLRVTFGGDMAAVASSRLLPEGGAVTASKTRGRLRAGVNWQGERTFMFLGLTHLTPEFVQQPTGQTLGSVSLLMRF